jgi:hypothetical protein
MDTSVSTLLTLTLAPLAPLARRHPDSLPVLLGNNTGESLQLPRHDLGRLLRLPLLEVLSDAEDDIDADLESSLSLQSIGIVNFRLPSSVGSTLTLVAINSSVSWKIVRRSEWPRMTQGRLRSFNWWRLGEKGSTGQFGMSLSLHASGVAVADVIHIIRCRACPQAQRRRETHEISPV